jgi:hypothetical protein
VYHLLGLYTKALFASCLEKKAKRITRLIIYHSETKQTASSQLPRTTSLPPSSLAPDPSNRRKANMFLTSKRLRSDASPPSSPLDNVSKRRRRDTTWPPSSSSSSSRPLPAEEHGLPEDPSPSTWANHRPYYPQSSQSFSQQQQHGGSSTSNPFGYNAIPLPSPLGFPSVINASSSSSFCSDTPPILLTDLPNNPNPADARPQSSYPQQTPDNLSLSQQNGYFPPTSSGPCTGGGGGSGGEQPLSQSSSIARMPWSGSTSQSGEIVGRVGERGRGAAAGGMRMEESPYAPMNQVLHDLVSLTLSTIVGCVGKQSIHADRPPPRSRPSVRLSVR